MAISAAIHHVTHYRYEHPIVLGPQVIRLRPAPHCRTPVPSYSLKIFPEGHFLNWQQDPHGNFLARAVFPEKVSEFRVEVALVADLEVYNPFDFFLEPDAEFFPFQYPPETAVELTAFTGAPVNVGPLFQKYVEGIDRTSQPTMEFLVDLNRQLEQHIRYLVRLKPGVQTPEETLKSESGSCRDSAWLLVNLCRALGLAARFVSGYLIQLKPDQPSLDGPSGAEEDFTDLHAWAEVYLPGAGWVGMDPTSGLLAAEGHLPVACTPSPASAAPISGGIEPVETAFEFSMDLHRVAEAPRVTKPYSDEAWERLNRLGQDVDRKLQTGDVRLTMGGEPTFVSIDDRDGDEWNTTAVGPEKRRLSAELLRRLWRRFAPGGFLHFGQGKWYPGESLPRWSFTCYWWRDGRPVWREPRWLGDLDTDYGFGVEEARAFLGNLTEALAVSPEYIIPAHEDTELAVDGAARLPAELRPRQQSLDAADLDPGTVRSALCVEPRDGKLFVFMPPLRSTEDYLSLLTAIEATAASLQMPVIIEGEKPPHDSRLEHFSVAPDPGVIEVNVHPASSWQELVEVTEGVYEEARLARLSTEKFLLDGRHTGTGEGNHIVVGGPHPADSPFLRRPDLLRSLIAYWHHHPSLSYLFSGLFIGPTSQSPRLDEARDDALYEMEIAFREIEEHQAPVPPWIVDRILRHLLTDVTGNTHRAEFCIDNLYSPDSATGRLGLLELRSFEMPPHARMSLAQQLLIRACIAWFWEHPYKPRKLARWGTALHDRFLLPHFVWQDFRDVLAELQEAGFAFEEEWFQAHYEFRFPFFGRCVYRDLAFELRGALEPWHVLGEEGAAGSPVKLIDSSVERLQAHVTGLPENRYLLACNGRALPLTSTGVAGEQVAGVRFRAWQPPTCLHPTIKPDVPLVFELIDTWSMRAVAGCTYHAVHPGGRNYEEAPVNSYAAESRRLSRFEPRGHGGAALDTLPAVGGSDEFPLTLDLRR